MTFDNLWQTLTPAQVSSGRPLVAWWGNIIEQKNDGSCAHETENTLIHAEQEFGTHRTSFYLENTFTYTYTYI